MPSPGSTTATPTIPSRAQPSTAISPPSGEYLMAFESRLATTCLSRLGAASATSASDGSRTASVCAALWAANTRAWSDTSGHRSTRRRSRGSRRRSAVRWGARKPAQGARAGALGDALEIEEGVGGGGEAAGLGVDRLQVRAARVGVRVAEEDELG